MQCDRCHVKIASMAEVGYMGPVDRDSLKCYAHELFITLCRECNLKHPDWRPPRRED